jgi:hypothetical protein
MIPVAIEPLLKNLRSWESTLDRISLSRIKREIHAIIGIQVGAAR